jgi:FAD/FMN-containing dehydrogenase
VGHFPPTIRSGGHCTAGFSAGSGFLIDVSNLNQVVIDPVNMTATIGCGCNFAKLNAALIPPGGRSRRAARSTATHPNNMRDRLHGMAS